MSKRIALVAGSNGPLGAGQLKHAVHDQYRLSKVLSSRICAFKVTDAGPKTSVGELRDHLLALTESCQPGDTLVVTFAGHAIIDGGELFLLWHESDFDRLLQTALAARDVFLALSRSRASHKLLVLDCCHAGAAAPEGFRSHHETSLKNLATEAENFIMLLASDRLERARELKYVSGGFLTSALCNALERGFDSDGDGQTSLADVVQYIRDSADRHNSNSPQDPVPLPLVVGRERGPFVLASPPAWQPWSYFLDKVEMIVLPLMVSPFHIVSMSRHPITNGQYRAFIDSLGHDGTNFIPVGEAYNSDDMSWHGPFYPWNEPLHNGEELPVTCVDYSKARAYCRWLSYQFGEWDSTCRPTNGVQLSESHDVTNAITLPTPTEWSFAAYGEFEPLAPRRSVTKSKRLTIRTQASIHHNSTSPSPIDHTGTRMNSMGMSDMFGNVWEWCLGAPLWRARTSRDGDLSDNVRTVELRGGGFLDDPSTVAPYIRASELRSGLRTSHTDLGFRISAFVRLHSLPHELQDVITYYGIYAPDDDRRFRLIPTGQ